MWDAEPERGFKLTQSVEKATGHRLMLSKVMLEIK